jgi:hypothetical protein
MEPAMVTREDLQRRIDELEASLKRLETHARNADGVLPVMLGVVAEASGVELDLDLDKDGTSRAHHQWLDHIVERFNAGLRANRE